MSVKLQLSLYFVAKLCPYKYEKYYIHNILLHNTFTTNP